MTDTPEARQAQPDTSDAPRRVVITGATGGLGPSVVEWFQQRGCELFLPVHGDPEAAQERFPGTHVFAADLTNAADARRVAYAVHELWGDVDAVVQLVGGFAAGSALTLTTEVLERQLDLNLRSVVHLSTALLPQMVETGRGSLVAVSAGAAEGRKNVAAYAASKAALEAYLRSVRAEVAPEGVNVGVLIPDGTLNTAANREAMPDADWSAWISLQAVAEAAWFLVTREHGGRVPEIRLLPS